MEDCLKTIESDIELYEFLEKLDELSGYIESDQIEVDKSIAKTVLSAFLNNWKFSTKETSTLLENYFSLLASVKFFNPIAKPFLKLITLNSGNRSVKWAYKLLRICCMLFTEEIPELKDAVTETKIKLIEEIAEKTPRLAKQAICFMISNSNMKTDDTIDRYLSEVVTICTNNKESYLLAGCYLRDAMRTTACRDTTLTILIKSYLSILSAARNTPSASIVSAGGVLVASSLHDVLTNDLFPSLSRAVKRNSDMAVPCMMEVMRCMKVDTSRYLVFLVDTSMYMFKQETADINVIRSFLSTILSRCSDGEAVLAFVEAILKETDSSRLTPALRRQMYVGLQTVVVSLKDKVMGKTEKRGFARKALDVLLNTSKTESNSACKACCMEIVGRLVVMAEEIPAGVMKLVDSSTKLGGAPLLYLISKMSAVPEGLTNPASLLPLLEDAVSRAVAKPFVSGREGVIALPAIVHLSMSAGQAVPSVVEKALAEGSFLYQTNILVASNKDDEMVVSWCNESVTALVSLLLKAHVLSATEEALLIELLFTQIIQAGRTSRETAIAVITDLAQDGDRVSQMLASLKSYLVRGSQLTFYCDEYPIAQAPLVLILQTLAHGRCSCDDVAVMAWCAMHPFLHASTRNITWHAVLTIVLRSVQTIEATDVCVASALAILHDELTCLTNANITLRAATEGMLEALAAVPTLLDALYPALLPEVSAAVASTTVNDVTSKDLSIWQTPVGVEWKPRQEDSGYVPEVSVTVGRKPRAKKGSNPFGQNDDEWAEELRNEIFKEKIAKEQAERAIAARTEALTSQAVVRDAVDAVALPYRRALLTLRALVSGARVGYASYVNETVQMVSSLLSNPLVESLARDVFGVCVEVVAADALRSALQNALFNVFYREFYSQDIVVMTHHLFEITTSVIATGDIHFCYLPLYIPVLKAVTFTATAGDAHADVVTLLEAFTTIDDELKEDTLRRFRVDICEVLLELLRVAPRLEPSPESVLMAFCDAEPSLQSREVLLLLGDRGMLSSSEDVRLNSLLNLDNMTNYGANPLYVIRLFMSQFDESAEIAEEAQTQWKEKELTINSSFHLPLFQLLGHSIDKIRKSAGCAIAQGLTQFPQAVTAVLDRVQKRCEEIDAMDDPKARLDQLDSVVSMFYMLQQCAVRSSFAPEELSRVLDILFNCAFSHIADAVRVQGMLAGEALMESYGEANTKVLLDNLNSRLRSMDKDAATEAEMIKQDHKREGCIVLLGKVTCFLTDGDSRILETTDTLIRSLSIPAASVQEAIARCLTPLFKYTCLRDNADKYVNLLLKQLTEGETYADRRGAALGLAGAIKGMSNKAFKDFNINGFIETAAQSESAHAREGAMLVLESLFDSLTFMFEPYVVKFLPLLLENFSHKDEGVREAAQGASRSVMRNLSPHGVKLVMPKVLEGLADSRWRTKQVAIQMLGSMAYCSPQSLSSCLPRIVPILTESCNDAHTTIQESARSALIDIGNVIRTPEIADLQSTLLKALTEPHLYTAAALKTLTETSFHHTIDAPSLSLIIPILMRGLSDRTTDTKKKAALIVGNICSLANREDVLPYLSKLLPPLKKCLMDPLPDVRAVAAHSIGMLGREVGEEEMKPVLDWLIEKVYEDSTVSERSGAAQGLADLLTSVTAEHFHAILDELLNNIGHPRPCVREGVLWTVSFLPSTLGTRFTSLIPVVLPAIVSGLADESEMVAEVALRAGQVIVKNFAKSNLAQVLPPVRDAMMDEDWRIRQSSIMLMGELLYTLGKTKAVGMAEDENDTGLSTDDVEQLLQKELGMSAWVEIMASLFYLTTDVTAAVRQSAFQVWKSVVNNTPRTLKKLLGALTKLCFDMFTSDSEIKRTLAARCLGEIVQKLGEYVIPHVLEVLNNGLKNDDPIIRQVICIGFIQVLHNCSSSILHSWGDKFLTSLKVSICDDDESVRAAAAEALTELQRKGNGDAFDSILPILLEDLEDVDTARQMRALNGIKQIIVLQGRQIIQTLFQRLTVHPFTVAHLHVMQNVVPSCSKYLHFFLTELTSDFLQTLYGNSDEPEKLLEDVALKEALHATLEALIVNVETGGVQWTITCLDKMTNYGNCGYRREGCMLVDAFCSKTTAVYTDQIQMILRLLLKRSADSDPKVIAAAWAALTTLLNKVKVDDMLQHVAFMSNMISTVISTERYKPGVDINTYVLPAFEQKDGLKPLFMLLQKGIMVASAERKADCASLICDLVQYSPPQNVRLYALQVTGPLIRIIGDKYNPEVRVTIFRALNLLLGKSGDALRPFLPQLQTTFIRALKDSSKGVREQGGQALVHIVKLSTRIDNVVNDLSDDVVSNAAEIRESIMVALMNLMVAVGSKLAPATRETVEMRMVVMLTNDEEDIRVLSANVLGVALSYTDDEAFSRYVEKSILSNGTAENLNQRHGQCLALGQLLKNNAERSMKYHPAIVRDVKGYLKDDSLLIRKSGISVCKYVLNAYNTMSNSNKKLVLDELIPELTACIYDSNSSVRYETVVSISIFGRVCKDTGFDLLGVLVPTLLKSVQDSYVPVKLASERALAHLLHINSNPEVLDGYIKTISPMDAKYLKTYVQRVLVKLPKTNDDDLGEF